MSLLHGKGARIFGLLALTSIVIFAAYSILRLDYLGQFSAPTPSFKAPTHDTTANDNTSPPIEDEVAIQTVAPIAPEEPFSPSLPHSLSEPAAASNPFAIKDRVAAIVETRPLDSLVPLILHFSLVLGPDWPVHLFTHQSTIDFYTSSDTLSAPFQRSLKSGQIRLVALPETAHFDSAEHVSIFLASKWFWDQLQPAEHVLLFQSDSIICANSQRRVEDFFKYGFVGAPIAEKWGSGFNGGLSLRNATLSRYIVGHYDFESENKDLPSDKRVEDQWFHRKMEALGALMPTYEEAVKFSVETVWGEEPLGYHQILRWNSDNLDKIERWCPEYRLATSETIASGSGEAGHG